MSCCIFGGPKFQIRTATKEDVASVKFLLDANKEIFGFIPRAAIEKSVADSEFIVGVLPCMLQIGIDGFCRYHKRKDGQTTMYEIFVRDQSRRMGLAAAMVELLELPILARCPVDLSEANKFYPAIGFRLVRVEQGKKRRLNVWYK